MLEGVSDVFKFFQASKLASVALLVTALCLIFGPEYFRVVPTVPEDWRWLTWGIMIFTGLQCVFWTLQAIVRASRHVANTVRGRLFPTRLRHLSDAEFFVLAVATDNDGYFSTEMAIHYKPIPQSIAISLAEQELINRGLMDFGYSGSYLTAKGKIFCLDNEIHKRINRKNLSRLT